MLASAEEPYVERHPAFRDAGFYRTVFDLQVSSQGIGTYLGNAVVKADRAYSASLITTGERGINFFDTPINYRHQRSERSIGVVENPGVANVPRVGRDAYQRLYR